MAGIKFFDLLKSWGDGAHFLFFIFFSLSLAVVLMSRDESALSRVVKKQANYLSASCNKSRNEIRP